MCHMDTLKHATDCFGENVAGTVIFHKYARLRDNAFCVNGYRRGSIPRSSPGRLCSGQIISICVRVIDASAVR